MNKEKSDKIFSVETPEESPGFLLWQVTNLWQREIKKALEKYDLTQSQFVLLASLLWLSAKKDPLTQVALSVHTKIDPMTTSTVLRALETRSLLERQEHLTDTRAKTVSLTARGRSIAKLAVKTVEQFDGDFFRPLGDKTKDFNAQLNLLLG
ncbi:MAG: MarR family transcriptional regulator [Candidatus Woesebacteria bacterium]